MKISLLPEFAGIIGQADPIIYINIALEHTETEHVFVGTQVHHNQRIFEVSLPMGNGLEENTNLLRNWLSTTCFEDLKSLDDDCPC